MSDRYKLVGQPIHYRTSAGTGECDEGCRAAFVFGYLTEAHEIARHYPDLVGAAVLVVHAFPEEGNILEARVEYGREGWGAGQWHRSD